MTDFDEDPLDLFDDDEDGVNEMCLLFDEKENKEQDGQHPNREKLHNRYVLTDIGGVFLGIGLDKGAEGESDDISLLGRDQYVRRWNQYAGNNGEFKLESESTIKGQKII